MKPSRYIILSKLSFALFITFLTMTLAATVWAGPTKQPLAGKTCVQLDEGFAAQLGVEEISLGIIEPAFQRGDKVCFPIRGGGIDLEDLRGEILHTGGLSFTKDGTTVELISFIIDTTVLEEPVLSGLVVVNGDLLDLDDPPLDARVSLFDLNLTDIHVRQKFKTLIIRNVGLTLTAEAAAALNLVFESGFEETDPVGVADVFAWLFSGFHDGSEI